VASVCAVVLTYNRHMLLRQCLEAITNQTRRCDTVLVVDNASRDGTLEMLQSDWGQKVTVLALSKNIGAAGGFNAGMRRAYEMGSDLIWVMDDDVIPEPDALETLLSASALLDDRGIHPPFLISNAFSPIGLTTNTPDIDLTQNSLSYGKWPLLLHASLVPVWRSTFVSILLPRETILRRGLPIAQMFMWGEDMEYTSRVTTNGPGYLVGTSRVTHVRALPGAPDIRNENDPVRVKYFYYHKRNQMFMKRNMKRRLQAKYVLNQFRLALKLLLNGSYHKSKLVVVGTLHGLTFNPAIEFVDDRMTDAKGQTLAVESQVTQLLGGASKR
jgi:GT2 family glycosyltransferase